MLPANVTSFVIRHLAEGSNYVFQVRAIAPQGAGRLAEILLTTPLRPSDPSRRKKSKTVRFEDVLGKSRVAASSPASSALDAAVATSAARSDKPAIPSSDASSTGHSMRDNLDSDRLKIVDTRESDSSYQRSEVAENDVVGKDALTGFASSLLSLRFSALFYVLPPLLPFFFDRF